MLRQHFPLRGNCSVVDKIETSPDSPAGKSAYDLDQSALRENFNRVASVYDQSAILQQEINRRLTERLDLIRLAPKRVLDLGCGTGFGIEELMRRYPKAQSIGVDFADAMLRKAAKKGRWWRRPALVSADMQSLPFADNSFDLAYSNLALHWCTSPDLLFAEIQRVLKPEGLFLFSSFGPDTLKELRDVWRSVDAYVHINRFLDMHDVGDALLRVGLADPVMDVESVCLTYADVNGLWKDLRGMGSRNFNSGRNRGLTGKSAFASMRSAYEQARRENLLPATFEIVYGHAWGVEPRTQMRDGVVAVPIGRVGRRR